MARIQAGPNVFGGQRPKPPKPQPPQQQPVQAPPAVATSIATTNETVTTQDINQELITSMNTIRATVETTNTDRTAYIISGVALLIISALAYQNNVMSHDRQAMSDLIRKMAPEAHHQLPIYDSPICLEVLMPSSSRAREFGSMYANYEQLLQQPDEEVVNYLSENQSEIQYTLPTLQKQTQSHISRLSALLESGCLHVFDKFKSLLPQFPADALHQAFRSASKVGAFLQLQAITDALMQKGVSVSDIDFDYALSVSDPRQPADAYVTLYAQVGNGPLESVYSSRDTMPTLEGHLHSQNNQFGSRFQERLTRYPVFQQHIASKFKRLIEQGMDHPTAQKELDLYLGKDVAHPTEASIYQQISKDLGIEKNNEGVWVSKLYIEGQWPQPGPTEIPA